eukprot:TRINITY_DN18251_c0_g1_i1.p1 TRINITY_DN18251_c0_g1~~TRINITY_DN18251_c0_g1_i1.p1  ORF type:complete len:493 (-),score=103.56 TRINITY_DN18251_c0_g1_i1:257-1735(-)
MSSEAPDEDFAVVLQRISQRCLVAMCLLDVVFVALILAGVVEGNASLAITFFCASGIPYSINVAATKFVGFSGDQAVSLVALVEALSVAIRCSLVMVGPVSSDAHMVFEMMRSLVAWISSNSGYRASSEAGSIIAQRVMPVFVVVTASIGRFCMDASSRWLLPAFFAQIVGLFLTHTVIDFFAECLASAKRIKSREAQLLAVCFDATFTVSATSGEVLSSSETLDAVFGWSPAEMGDDVSRRLDSSVILEGLADLRRMLGAAVLCDEEAAAAAGLAQEPVVKSTVLNCRRFDSGCNFRCELRVLPPAAGGATSTPQLDMLAREPEVHLGLRLLGEGRKALSESQTMKQPQMPTKDIDKSKEEDNSFEVATTVAPDSAAPSTLTASFVSTWRVSGSESWAYDPVAVKETPLRVDAGKADMSSMFQKIAVAPLIEQIVPKRLDNTVELASGKGFGMIQESDLVDALWSKPFWEWSAEVLEALDEGRQTFGKEFF